LIFFYGTISSHLLPILTNSSSFRTVFTYHFILKNSEVYNGVNTREPTTGDQEKTIVLSYYKGDLILNESKMDVTRVGRREKLKTEELIVLERVG
jgi:hypothetical protein